MTVVGSAGPTPSPPVAALSIAGSDSGGGAGIQMDLRTMHRLGVFATTAICAITAQNLGDVTAVEGLRPHTVVAQIDAVIDGFPIAAIKTGMLWSAELIESVADRLALTSSPLVVDPVMVATSGSRLLGQDTLAPYRRLIGQATLVTPNLDEAAVFLNSAIDVNHIADEASRLADRLGCPVLLKGGHLDGPPIDVLATGDARYSWRHERVEGVNSHGTGCMLSSAIAALLALGRPLVPACAGGLAFVHDALVRGAAEDSVHRLARVETAVADESHLEPLQLPTTE